MWCQLLFWGKPVNHYTLGVLEHLLFGGIFLDPHKNIYQANTGNTSVSGNSPGRHPGIIIYSLEKNNTMNITTPHQAFFVGNLFGMVSEFTWPRSVQKAMDGIVTNSRIGNKKCSRIQSPRVVFHPMSSVISPEVWCFLGMFLGSRKILTEPKTRCPFGSLGLPICTKTNSRPVAFRTSSALPWARHDSRARR